MQVLLGHSGDLRELAAGGSVRWLGYVSSTSVYGDWGGAWVDEQCDPHSRRDLFWLWVLAWAERCIRLALRPTLEYGVWGGVTRAVRLSRAQGLLAAATGIG